MTSDDTPPTEPAAPYGSAIADAAALITAARRAALATFDTATGHPYASLVTVAPGPAGRPVLLLSRLARHTRNLAADPRASLLFEPSGLTRGDPLALARVTALGRVDIDASPQARAAFLACHPDAAGYAAFADFAIYALAIEAAHFIGGFGRIVELDGTGLQSAVVAATTKTSQTGRP